MQDYWWLWFWLFMVLSIQGDHLRRRLRIIEAKLDAALRRLGDNPTKTETALELRDQAAEADAKALARRSVHLGLIVMLIGGAIGALVGWLLGGGEGVAAATMLGGFIGYFAGIFLYGFWEGIPTGKEEPQKPRL
jgi:hypothetical protein